MVGSVIQMWTMFMATLERVRSLRQMSDKLPRGPPRARQATSSSPHTDATMFGVHALAPVRSRVRRASMRAMSHRVFR
jgi:hypothetical protein